MRVPWHGELGSGVALAGTGLVLAVVLLAAVVEVTAYLAAAGRAQAGADAAALAAVQRSDPRGGASGSPTAAARGVAAAGGGRLVNCVCAEGRREVRVEVAVGVASPALAQLRPDGVVATARAELVAR